MLDLEDKFFTAPFTANIRPSKRYGHAVAGNISDKDLLMHEVIILGGLDVQFCTMDPYVLQETVITEHTKWELAKVSKVKSDNTSNLEATIKLANKNIMDNRKIIAQLEKN